MHVILGATGHVGSAVATALLDRGEPVTVVTRDARRAERFARRGAAVAVVDVGDATALGAALARGRSAFLLMPPADPATNTVAEERRLVASLVRAVERAAEGAQLTRAVVQSTYGAQPGEALGDLGVLHELEQAVGAIGARTGLRTRVIRAAYYLSNWDAALATARDAGVVYTFFPADFALPMVAPADLGAIAARLLTEDARGPGVHYVEGPARYTPREVAHAFAAALGREVRTVETPRPEWEAAMRTFGFSAVAAASYARMLAITLDGTYERPTAPERGPTTLRAYVDALVRRGTAEQAPW